MMVGRCDLITDPLAITIGWQVGKRKAFWFFELVENLGDRMAIRKRGTHVPPHPAPLVIPPLVPRCVLEHPTLGHPIYAYGVR
jgi:hypothetical protein